MRIVRLFAATAALALAALGLSACEPRDIPSVLRDYEAVVLTGADTPDLQGIDPGRLVAFRFVYSVWQQIPVQVDERAVLDLAKPKNQAPIGKTALFYTDAGTWTGADPNATLDTDDEIVFMARDAFGQARSIDDDVFNIHYTLDEPTHVVPGSGVEIELNDPLVAGSASWVYLFESDGTLDPGAGGSYVDYEFDLLSGDYKTTYHIGSGPNPEDSIATTASYSMHFADRWNTDRLDITTDGASGIDILDRHKSGFAGSCARSDGTFANGPGALIANKSGPVRAIRSYLGANSGTYTQRDHLLYESRADVVTYLRVHAIPAVRDWFDYAPAAAGMTFSTDTNPTGVTIDGSPDAYPSGWAAWQLVKGSPGAVVHTGWVDTNWSYNPANRVLYYSDDTTPSETQCTGDAYEYGASGAWINQSVPCTDPAQNCTLYVNSTRRMTFLPPTAAGTDAAQIADETDTPLGFTAVAFTP